MFALKWFMVGLPLLAAIASGSNILMITMGGTKSHKMPFWALARGLIKRNHNVTFISAFAPDFHLEGLEEIAPEGLVSYIREYMSIDLVGARLRGEEPLPYADIVRFAYESCDAFLSDFEMRSFLSSGRNYDLAVVDGAFPECGLGVAYKFKAPFIYINTVGFNAIPFSSSGGPTPFSVTPFFASQLTDDMNLIERTVNTIWHIIAKTAHTIVMAILQGVLRKHLGPEVPHVNDLARNVSFILQNGHYSVTYLRPHLPNVADIACIHCNEPKRLSSDMEEWISGAGEAGFVYVSMGSSVRTSKMPLSVHRLFMTALGRLPQRVIWKQDSDRNTTDIPLNIKLYKWVPQQDLLGHPKIKAFVTQAGLMSMLETIYHGVPVITIPVFCDQNANAAAAETDGYAKKLELKHLTSNILYKAITDIINDPKYKMAVKQKQLLLRDQIANPLDTAIYWTEFVLRHKGAYQLQSPAKDLNIIQYYLLDVIFIILTSIMVAFILFSYILRKTLIFLINFVQNQRTAKQMDQTSLQLALTDHGTNSKKEL